MPELESTHGAAHAAEPAAEPPLVFDFSQQRRELLNGSYWRSGRNSKTVAKYDDFRIVLVALQAGTTIHEHRTAGRVSVQAIEGRLRMHAGGREFDLETGHVLVLDRAMPHDVIALKDSTFMLTIAGAQGTEH